LVDIIVIKPAPGDYESTFRKVGAIPSEPLFAFVSGETRIYFIRGRNFLSSFSSSPLRGNPDFYGVICPLWLYAGHASANCCKKWI
jgi:hypothetical protein